MSGTTISNWGAFDKSLFTGMRDVGSAKKNEEGVLATQVAEIKAGHLPASTVKQVFLGIVTFGIYNICHKIREMNQRETTAALKQGVDDIHHALSYISIQSRMCKQVFETARSKGDASVAGQRAPSFSLNASEAKTFFAGSNISVENENGSDSVFGDKPFLRMTIGGVVVDICPKEKTTGATVRINGVESTAPLRLGQDYAAKLDYTLVELPDIEDALYRLEKDIVRTTDIFGGDLVESMLSRYDTRLGFEKTIHQRPDQDMLAAGQMKEWDEMQGRKGIKDRQLELCRDILTMRCGMSQERLDYLDRDLAKQLAIQAVKNNVTSGPALDAHYDKIVSQRHLVGEDMLALYKKLDGDSGLAGKIHLPPSAPPALSGAGRPTAQQQAVHDFAADLVLAEDISDYDRDVGKSGNLDGMRLRNVFEKHHDTIAALMDARAADKGNTPAALASLDPAMRNAIMDLLDTLEDMKAQAGEKAQKEHRFSFSASSEPPPAALTNGQFLFKLVNDFDVGIRDAEKFEKGASPVPSSNAVSHLVEVDDLSDVAQAKAGIKDTPDDDYRRHGKMNFFAQLELKLNKGIEEAMAGSVQAQVKTMIASVFPQENPAALNPKSSLTTIVADRASDPQMKLLKQTLDVYFERMGSVDKRNMMARLVRHTVDGAPNGIRFGEILKGAGPILQKMMQGLDPDAFTDPDFRLAIADMRSKLAPIPEKAVKAQFADLIARSNGAIESITVRRALGAASVGQTFLCAIQMQGEREPRECVIKMLRPDAQMRALREAEIFRDVAKGIDGMSMTFEGKLDGIMKELDLTVEAANVRTGLDVYDAGTHRVNKTFHNVSSMRLSEIPGTEPTKGLMVLERAPGVPMDKYLSDASASIARTRQEFLDGAPTLTDMLAATRSLTAQYEDALAKHDALTNLTTIWIREGLFTKTGFYHGDLHAGNIMVPTLEDLSHGVDNGVTMIDFGNATQLTPDEQKNVIRIIAGAAGNDPELFLNGLDELLSPAGKASLAGHRQEVEGIVRDVLSQGTGNDAGLRMTAVFKLLQARFSIEVPSVISGFQSSQERLTVAMESMLRTITSAEVACLDVILAEAANDGAAAPAIAPTDSPAQVFAKKKAAAIDYLNGKLAGDLPDDVRNSIGELKEKLVQADKDRPMSMMQCMVAVIKQNIVTSLKTLGTSSAKTVTDHLKADHLIGGTATAAASDTDKERRFVEIRP